MRRVVASLVELVSSLVVRIEFIVRKYYSSAQPVYVTTDDKDVTSRAYAGKCRRM